MQALPPIAVPMIYYKMSDKPLVIFEKGNQDIDFWYYWAKTALFKEDYEPVREEGAANGNISGVLTRFGWNHVYTKKPLLVGGRIEVLFIGPGKTPFIRTSSRYNEATYVTYKRSHRNLIRDSNYQCTPGSPPVFYKTAGKKPHFPDIIKNYNGWPELR